jgi:hypothetical protein
MSTKLMGILLAGLCCVAVFTLILERTGATPGHGREPSHAGSGIVLASPTSRQSPPTGTNGLTDPEGWSQAHWGMTEKQVLSAFHGEAKVLTGDRMNRQYKDRLATVGIDHVAIGEIEARALFLFDGAGELDMIRLLVAHGSDDQFTTLEETLSKQHGEPQLRGGKSSAFLAAWMFPRSVVELFYIPSLVLTVAFDKRSNQTADSIMKGYGTAQRRHTLITKADYGAIQAGMTYPQVIWMIGTAGEELSRSDVVGYTTVMYSWKNSNGSNMNAMFQNGRLVTKAQFQLR